MNAPAEAVLSEYMKTCNLWRKNAEWYQHLPKYSQDGLTRVNIYEPQNITEPGGSEEDQGGTTNEENQPSDSGNVGGGTQPVPTQPIQESRISTCVHCGRLVRDHRPCCCEATERPVDSGNGGETQSPWRWLGPVLGIVGITAGIIGGAIAYKYGGGGVVVTNPPSESALQYLEDRGGHLAP